MLDKVTEILRDYKDNADLVVTEASTFEELELDSLDTVDLIMNMEDAFGVTIKLDEAIKTVGDLIKLIQQAQ